MIFGGVEYHGAGDDVARAVIEELLRVIKE